MRRSTKNVENSCTSSLASKLLPDGHINYYTTVPGTDIM